jgi:hypothetical protein
MLTSICRVIGFHVQPDSMAQKKYPDENDSSPEVLLCTSPELSPNLTVLRDELMTGGFLRYTRTHLI